MALSDEEITHGQKCLQIWQRFTSLPMVSHHAKFAKAIEKEVRKDDEALIRQMLEAMEPVSAFGRVGSRDVEQAALQAAITAARARLEKTP